MSGMDSIIAIHGVSPPSTFRVPSTPVPKCVLFCCRLTDNLCFAEEDSDLVCQPGVGWMEINETLKEKGIPLFFPVRAES
jgi:FAD/FMN-containing dehydrogenase